MPRPQPIVIPGQGSMGSSVKRRESFINPEPLIKLFQYYQQQQADETAAVALARMMGIGNTPAPRTISNQDTMGGGLVNMPQQTPMDVGASSKSPQFQKTIFDVFKKFSEPTKYEHAAPGSVAFNPLNPRQNFQLGDAGSNKEFNAPNNLETFLMQTNLHGADYTTPEGRKTAQRWASTPEGSKMFNEWMRTAINKDSYKDQYVGPSLDNPGKDIWATYDKAGKGVTELREGAGIALPKNIGRTPTTAISQAGYMKHAQDRIDQMSKDYRPEYVGWLQNQNIFGLTANELKSRTQNMPDSQIRFYRNLWDMNDAMIRKSEGAVVPEAMMARLQKFMNDLKLTPQNFESQFNDLANMTKQDMRNLHESLQGQFVSPFKDKNVMFWSNDKPILGNKNETIQGAHGSY